MYVNPGSWHAKLYFACLAIWHKFKTGNDWVPSKYERQTNLCFYMRTIMVWAPLVVVLHLALVAAAVGTFVLLPINLFGFMGYGKTIGTIGGVIGLFWLVMYLADRFWPTVKETSSQVVRKAKPALDKGASATEVVVEWTKARKRQVCPFINFETEGGTR